MIRKSFAALTLFSALCLPLAACSTNEATGRSQFTGLMNTAQENQIGGSEQTKAQQQFGIIDDPKVSAYVNNICTRLTPAVERTDVKYSCTVLDSPVVNAFALPGGYININRGLLAYANSEAEVASVLAHEMGHVTARHISERYSQSTLTQLGGAALSIALGSSAANQLIGLGSNMYLSSYSRGQETEADDLGIRYLQRSGYDPMAMAWFLSALQRESALSAAEQGQEQKEMRSFMATHPLTSDRVARATSVAANIPNKAADTGTDRHLNVINGMVYGDSPKDGFVRGREFVHPAMGFAFMAPESFNIKNGATQVAGTARSGSGAAFVFDAAQKPAGMDPATYIKQQWIPNQPALGNIEAMDANGKRGATGQIQGSINGRAALMRVVAIEWSPTEVYRFQFAMPQTTTTQEIETFKAMSYSLRALSTAERNNIRPKRISVVTASAGDSVQSMAARMAFSDGLNDQRFMAQNGINPGEGLVAGKRYKIVVE